MLITDQGPSVTDRWERGCLWSLSYCKCIQGVLQPLGGCPGAWNACILVAAV
jgi:hypothetical protein